MAAGREERESSKQTTSLEEESKGERGWEGNWKLKFIDLLRGEGGRNWKERK
jgi:subtilisin-like proprotein convertase family protein